jgi:GNAT superfamily N-acetyltransferase
VFLSSGGMIGGMLCPYWAAPGDVQAIELFWFATDGQGRALLGAFEEWAREQGASEMRVTSRPTRALERMGYEPVDTIYRRRF